MRKYFILATILWCGFSLSATAQSDEKYNREMEKVYKKSSKELKKEGWHVSGTSLTLDAVLMKHLCAVNVDDGNGELVAEVTMCKSVNVCKANTLNNALIEYANSAGFYIRGRMTSDMFNNSSADVPEEFDKFYTAYERFVSAEVKGELQFNFAVEKANGTGKSYRAYYIVDEEKASKARPRAMQRAFDETKIAQGYAGKVSAFV